MEVVAESSLKGLDSFKAMEDGENASDKIVLWDDESEKDEAWQSVIHTNRG